MHGLNANNAFELYFWGFYYAPQLKNVCLGSAGSESRTCSNPTPLCDSSKELFRSPPRAPFFLHCFFTPGLKKQVKEWAGNGFSRCYYWALAIFNTVAVADFNTGSFQHCRASVWALTIGVDSEIVGALGHHQGLQ